MKLYCKLPEVRTVRVVDPKTGFVDYNRTFIINPNEGLEVDNETAKLLLSQNPNGIDTKPLSAENVKEAIEEPEKSVESTDEIDMNKNLDILKRVRQVAETPAEKVKIKDVNKLMRELGLAVVVTESRAIKIEKILAAGDKLADMLFSKSENEMVVK